MSKLTSLTLAATMAVFAASADAAPIYATSVVSFTPGTFKRVEAGRADPASALGGPDGKFVSLGFGGSLILAFSRPFKAIGHIFEVTWNDPRKQIESADIYGYSNSTFTLIGSVKNYLSTSFDAEGVFSQLKIVDTSSKKSTSFDGFDIDSVSVSPVPVPAAGLLLGGALFGLGALRRRIKRAA